MNSPHANMSAPPDTSPILVVDDSLAASNALERLLQAESFSCVSFMRGIPALAYARTNPVRAVIVDVHMPDLSGLILTGELRRLLGPGTPIIAVSGDSSMETLNSLSVAGATWFYQKPVSGKQLIHRLRVLLGAETLLSEIELAEDPGHPAVTGAPSESTTTAMMLETISGTDQAHHLRDQARRSRI